MKRRTLLLSATTCHAGFAPLISAAASRTGIDFIQAFPRKFYQKKYFGLAITGATVVTAGVVTYFTAGTGAPVAAAGVSTVAAWVGGGGAGSYMAGLATIGGWFGGNAMLGAAILNGVSLGTVGGAAAWKALPAAQKAVSLASMAATAMDGIAAFENPKTGQMEWRIILPVPIGLASESLYEIIEDLDEVSKELASLANKEMKKSEATRTASGSTSPQLERPNSPEFNEATTRHEKATKRLEETLDRAMNSGSPNSDTIVLAVLAHNEGKSRDFRTLIGRIEVDPLVSDPYVDYLRAIAALQVGRIRQAEQFLFESIRAAPYAIEPFILLVTVLGNRDFRSQQQLIGKAVDRAVEAFDPDKYITMTSLAALHYRVGSIAYKHKEHDIALREYQKAQDAMSLIEEYWSRKDVRDLLEIGRANALYGSGRIDDSKKIFESVKSRTKSDDAKAILCDQYAGGC